MNRTGRPHEIEPAALDLSVVLRARTEIGESPVWSQRTQELYFVDIAGQAIHTYRPSDGRQRVFTLPDLVTSVSLRVGVASSCRSARRSRSTIRRLATLRSSPIPSQIGRGIGSTMLGVTRRDGFGRAP